MLYLKLPQVLALHRFRVEGGLNDGFGDLVVTQLLESSVDLALLFAHGRISLLQVEHRLQGERLHARIAVLKRVKSAAGGKTEKIKNGLGSLKLNFRTEHQYLFVTCLSRFLCINVDEVGKPGLEAAVVHAEGRAVAAHGEFAQSLCALAHRGRHSVPVVRNGLGGIGDVEGVQRLHRGQEHKDGLVSPCRLQNSELKTS